ncbi:MAG TPA: glycosyltransferase family 9 protein [bacterium]|nr:MAG: ADP-heptose--LPS heptosyltransferase 2 [bacterium ADurb.Bin236]HOY63300.1 glycosyltransferase family 9 protein [bacterium]HPI76254.1 glycosyltransferase family 9 protein [bacterium]HPN94781.1 glycosyltransferase family 9 protein [bacterium]
MAIDKSEIKKILIIKISAIGDIVRVFPAIVSVAKMFPEARISFMTSEQYVSLVEPCPYISEIIPYKKRRNLEGLPEFLKFAMGIRARGFDMVLNLQNTKRYDIIAKLSGASHTTKIVNLDRPVDGVEGVFKVLATAGIEPKRRHYEFWFTDEDRERAGEFLARNGLSETDKIAGVNPGAGWKSKQWPVEKYAELSKRLVEKDGMKVVVFGSAEERSRAERIKLLAGEGVFVDSGESSIREAAFVISKCSTFISNDSGLMHIAAIQDVPTVGIFGSTNPAYHRPCREGNIAIFRAVDCSPCSSPECKLDFEKYYCLTSISVDEVYKAVRSIKR